MQQVDTLLLDVQVLGVSLQPDCLLYYIDYTLPIWGMCAGERFISYYRCSHASTRHWALTCSLPHWLRPAASWRLALNIIPWNQTPGWIHGGVLYSEDGTIMGTGHMGSNIDQNRMKRIQLSVRTVIPNKRTLRAWMWGKSKCYENEYRNKMKSGLMWFIHSSQISAEIRSNSEEEKAQWQALWKISFKAIKLEFRSSVFCSHLAPLLYNNKVSECSLVLYVASAETQ